MTIVLSSVVPRKDLGKGIHDCVGCKTQIEEAVRCPAGSQAGPAKTREKYPSAALNEFGEFFSEIRHDQRFWRSP